MNLAISRRSFLKATGLTLAVSVTPLGYDLANASEKRESFKPHAWIEITPDNRITIAMGISEMGQGSSTSLPMIVADELEADWTQVRVVQGPAADQFFNPLLFSQATFASASVRGFYEPLRKAGAAGRAMLIKAAAETWNVPEGECLTLQGTVAHKKSNRSLTYGQLCLKAASLEVPKDPPLKNEIEFRYIGKPMARLDVPEKVAGKAVFGLDVSVPDMLYAVLARPPAYGAKSVSYDQSAAEQIKGVRKVVQTPNGIAVIADSMDAAWKGRGALRVQWDKGSRPDMDTASIEKHFMEGLDKPGVIAVNTGDAKKALGEASRKVEATYFVPFVAHATMEPMNCTAYVQKDRCDVWAPTSGQTIAQMAASKVSGVAKDKVHVHTTFLGCGLGRRSDASFVIEAVLASKAVGRPVKVVWSREEDIKYNPYRAATCQRIEAGLDRQGRLTGWSHKVSCSSILRQLNPAAIKNGVDFYSLFGITDAADSRNYCQTAYTIPNFYVEQVLSDLPVPVRPWRSIGNAPNAFVMESFMDELASTAGKDPLEFRLQLLGHNMRSRRVLETVAEKAGWGKPVPKGMGRGIAQHVCFGAHVAAVADVSVNDKGKIHVHKVTFAIDCGPVINPDSVAAQVEGCVVLGISSSMMEKIEFADGGVRSSNFDDYRLARMSDTPEIEVHLIKSKEKIGGVGEPPVTPIAPAIANAVFNATGMRIRCLPMTPETVRGAMKKT